MGKLITLEKMITSFQLHSQPHYILCHHTFPSSMPYMKLMRTSSSNPSNSVTLVAIQGRITSTFTFVISTCKRETLCGSCLFLEKPSPSRHPCWKEEETANNNINEKSACWLTSMIWAYIPLPEPQNFHELGCHTTARIALRKTGKRRRRKRKTEPTNRTRWQGNMWNHQGHTNLTSTSSSGANFWLLSSFFILLEKRVSWSADVPCSHMNTHTQSHQQTTLSNSKLQT